MNDRLKSGKEKREYVAGFYDLTNVQAEILREMITEVSSHHIEDKVYRELCLNAKQLQRDLEVLLASYMTSETRIRTLRRVIRSVQITPDIHERRAKQATIEHEIWGVALGLKAIIEEGLDYKSKRFVPRNLFRPVNTAVI